jgi:hypothetical protein
MNPSDPIQATPIVDDLDHDPILTPASPNNHHHDEEAIRKQEEAKLEATTLLFLKSE